MDDLEGLSQDLRRWTLELDTKRELDKLRKQVEEQNRRIPMPQPTSPITESYKAAFKEAERKQREINDFLTKHGIRYLEDRDRFVAEKDKELDALYDGLASLNAERKECTDGRRLRQIDDEAAQIEEAIPGIKELIATAKSIKLNPRPIRPGDLSYEEAKELKNPLPQTVEEIKPYVDQYYSNLPDKSVCHIRNLYRWQYQCIYSNDHLWEFVTLPVDLPDSIEEFRYKGSENGYITINARDVRSEGDEYYACIDPNGTYVERYVDKNLDGSLEYNYRTISGLTVAKRYLTRKNLVRLGLLPPVPDKRPPEAEVQIFPKTVARIKAAVDSQLIQLDKKKKLQFLEIHNAYIETIDSANRKKKEYAIKFDADKDLPFGSLDGQATIRTSDISSKTYDTYKVPVLFNKTYIERYAAKIVPEAADEKIGGSVGDRYEYAEREITGRQIMERELINKKIKEELNKFSLRLYR